MLQLYETCILQGCHDYLDGSSKHTRLWTPIDFVSYAASWSLLQYDTDGHTGLAVKMMDIQRKDTVPWLPGEEALKEYLLMLVLSCSSDLGEWQEILDITCSNSIILQMRELEWGRASSPWSQMSLPCFLKLQTVSCSKNLLPESLIPQSPKPPESAFGWMDGLETMDSFRTNLGLKSQWRPTRGRIKSRLLGGPDIPSDLPCPSAAFTVL